MYIVILSKDHKPIASIRRYNGRRTNSALETLDILSGFKNIGGSGQSLSRFLRYTWKLLKLTELNLFQAFNGDQHHSTH